MMLKKSRVKFTESEIVTYPTTQMMRNLLVAQVCAQKVVQILSCHVFKFSLVDTKFFSLKSGGFQRPEAVSDDVPPREL